MTNLKVGDRVFVAGNPKIIKISTNSSKFNWNFHRKAPEYTAGSYAEYIVMNEIYVFPLHHKMSFA